MVAIRDLLKRTAVNACRRCASRSGAHAQSEHCEALKGEVKAKRRTRPALAPILLYTAFLLGSLAYVYARVRYGVSGLTLGLVCYSYILLAVELLGIVNMVRRRQRPCIKWGRVKE